MSVSPDARTPSADLHHLTGSTPPGAARAMQPFGIATAPAANADDTFMPLDGLALGVIGRLRPAHPDAEVIDLAERVAALAERWNRVGARLAKREDAVQSAVPPLSAPPQPANRVKVTNVETEGWYTSTISHPTTPATSDERYAAAMAAWNAEVAEKVRAEAALKTRLRIPQWEALSDRTTRCLVRWTYRLTYMRPRTRDGLKAKAAASIALMQTGGSETWAVELHAGVSRDALRIICTEAEARAEQDRQADGELLALGRAWEASCARYERACAAEEALDDAFDLIAPPCALIARPGDLEATCCCAASDEVGNPFGQPWYGRLDKINTLRRMAQGGTANARRDEILGAYDRWLADVAAENERSGLVAAWTERQASADENGGLRIQICKMLAHTRRGVDLKLRVVLWLHDGLDGLAREMEPENIDSPEFSASLALSLVLDLARQSSAVDRRVEPVERAA